MYLRYDENQTKELIEDLYKKDNKVEKPKKKEMSNFELVVALSFIIWLLEYTKENTSFNTTSDQFIIAFVSACVLKFIIESFHKWISK